MAYVQVDVPFYEELNKTFVVKPITLPVIPTASSPGHPVSCDNTKTTSSGYFSSADSRSAHSQVQGISVIRASSDPRSHRSRTQRRLGAKFQPALISGAADSKRLSGRSRSQDTGNSTRQTQAVKDDNTWVSQKGRRRSSPQREVAWKMEVVSRVVSPDATAVLPNAVLMGTDSACLESDSSSLRDTDKNGTLSREEDEAQLMHEFRLKRDRVCVAYQKRVERMAADFSKIRNELRALHLQERRDLNKMWGEDCLDTLHDFLVDSKQFEYLSDEDYDRDLRQLAKRNERKLKSDVKRLEKRHMADWRRFLSDKKVSLVQLQEALEQKLEQLDTEEERRIPSLRMDFDWEFK